MENYNFPRVFFIVLSFFFHFFILSFFIIFYYFAPIPPLEANMIKTMIKNDKNMINK